MTLKRIILALALVLLSAQVQAKLSLPEIIGDNMVLQQQTKVNIWGWATPGASVRVKASWSSATVSARAAADGRWIAKIDTPAASYTPQTVTISADGEKVVLKDVLIGEVWFASGQSNMEMPIHGFWNCPVEGANRTIADAMQYNKGLRMVTVPKTGSHNLEDRVKGSWQQCSPETVRWWSATATYFGERLCATLDIPVGIISCSWGGSRVESWLPEETVRGYGDIDFEKETNLREGNWWHYSNVTIMYNAMYYPIRDYTVQGFIWYQGESNVGKEDSYAERFKTLAGIWRADQGREAPIYWVELAPWRYGGDGRQGARFREMQFRLSNEIPNSAMVCTNDLVYPDEDTQIHPRNKQGVGERLAWCALNNTYGYENIKYRNPSYKEYKIEGNVVEIFLNDAPDGIYPWKGLEGFEVAGNDRVFYPAVAWINQNDKSVMVMSPDVQYPKAVRYCFKDFSIGNVKSVYELPLVPFRTDDWDY